MLPGWQEACGGMFGRAAAGLGSRTHGHTSVHPSACPCSVCWLHALLAVLGSPRPLCPKETQSSQPASWPMRRSDKSCLQVSQS